MIVCYGMVWSSAAARLVPDMLLRHRFGGNNLSKTACLTLVFFKHDK